MNLLEILDQPKGFTPPVLDCKIVKIWDRKTGQGEYGEWSFQSVDITDLDGNKGKLTLKNVPPMAEIHQGQTCKISCKSTEKHGLTGIKVDIDKQKKKVLVITGSASFKWAGEQDNNDALEQRPVTNEKAPASNDLIAVFEEHLRAIQDLAIDLKKRAEQRLGRPIDGADPSLISANQIVMAARDNGLWFKLTPEKRGAPTGPAPLSPDEINDEDIPF